MRHRTQQGERIYSQAERGGKRMARLLFLVALVMTLLFALAPHPPVIIAYDKAQHGMAFGVLAILARMAFPELPWPFAALALAGVGGAIEVIQFIPALHHSCDVYDWYADIGAIAAGLAIYAIAAKWRANAT